MLKRFRKIFISAIVLFIALNAGAQMTMPDSVLVGAQKRYRVDPNPVPGSVYTWQIDGVVQAAFTTREIEITWNRPGTFLLEVQEQSSDGCYGPVRSGQVFVAAPDFSVPPPISECVEDIAAAIYDTDSESLNFSQPDYYIFMSGDVRLDLDTATFTTLHRPVCPVEIRWKIEMNDGTRIPALPKDYLTGQPSAYATNIMIPGDGVNYRDAVHTITYWIRDCAGNLSAPKIQTITIKPRPNILIQN